MQMLFDMPLTFVPASAAGGAFEERDVIRYRPREKFDLIWSGGLFDYFSDRMFVRLLGRLLKAVRPGGEVIIGNFSPSNPSRAYMELLGGWCLEYRSKQQLLDLAQELVSGDEISIEGEPEGVILFLRIKPE
jgi:SAM-dependent methyltransferase